MEMKSIVCAVCAGIAAVASAEEKPELVVGVLSDVHMRTNADWVATIGNFKKALRFYDRAKADAVFCCGDMIEFGWWDWYHLIGDCWFEVFPDNRRSDGQPVEKCFIFGDHEIENFVNPGIVNNYPADFIRAHDIPTYGRKKIYEEILKEPWAPIMKKTVKGYDVIMANFTFSSNDTEFRSKDCYWGQNIPHLREFLSTNALHYAKPFFYLQHKVIARTVIAPNCTGQNELKDRETLNAYPNCVAFCGHKHKSATAEHSLWQDEFTCVQVPSLQSVQTDAGHENGWASCDGYAPAGRIMPTMRTFEDAGQGLLMKVYRDRIVLERWNLRFEEKVAADWVIPWPVKPDHPASFEARARKSRPPKFPAGARLDVKTGKGKDRTGAERELVTVSFPAAHSAADADRGYDYRVTAELRMHHWTRIACEKLVYSPKICLPEARDTNAVSCVFTSEQVPPVNDGVRFIVTPYNAFQIPGAAITSDWKKVEFGK